MYLHLEIEAQCIGCCYKEALTDLDKALKIGPENVFALENRGAVHRMLSNYYQALIDLEKALEIDPQDVLLDV